MKTKTQLTPNDWITVPETGYFRECWECKRVIEVGESAVGVMRRGIAPGLMCRECAVSQIGGYEPQQPSKEACFDFLGKYGDIEIVWNLDACYVCHYGEQLGAGVTLLAAVRDAMKGGKQ